MLQAYPEARKWGRRPARCVRLCQARAKICGKHGRDPDQELLPSLSLSPGSLGQVGPQPPVRIRGGQPSTTPGKSRGGATPASRTASFS